MKTIQVLTNQSIFDLALQEFGSAEGVVSLMLDNANTIIDLNSEVEAGMQISITSAILDSNVVAQLKVVARAGPESQNAHIATWPPDAPAEIPNLILTETGQPILSETQNPLQTEF